MNSNSAYELKSKYDKFDRLFSISVFLIPILSMLAAYFYNKSMWGIIGYGLLFFIIAIGFHFIITGFIVLPLVEKKIKSLLNEKIKSLNITPDLKGYWQFKMFVVDIKQKKFVYFSEANKYEPFILNNTEIISVKVTNKSETSINHNKSKVETKDDFSLELQYQKENDIVKTIVIPYGDDRIQAEEVGRTIGRL